MTATNEPRIACVCALDGSDFELHKLIIVVLAENGIWATCYGSVVYNVFVHEGDEETASNILKTDARLRSAHLLFP
jgi:hypothetical protein